MNENRVSVLAPDNYFFLKHLLEAFEEGRAVTISTEANHLYAQKIGETLFQADVVPVFIPIECIGSGKSILDSLIRMLSGRIVEGSEEDKTRHISETIIDLHDAKVKVAIIAEDADLMSAASLKTLLKINEFERDSKRLCGVILIGGYMLSNTLAEVRREQKEETAL